MQTISPQTFILGGISVALTFVSFSNDSSAQDDSVSSRIVDRAAVSSRQSPLQTVTEIGTSNGPKYQPNNIVAHESLPQNGEIEPQPILSGEETDHQVKQAELRKKAASSHKPLFFDNDFSYLLDDAYQDSFLGDNLKMRGLPGSITYDIGGQYRSRYHSERNLRGLGLTGVDDKFLLHRTRVYGNFRLSPNVRVYAEMLDAESNFENFGPRPIEVNRTEIQNLFVDVRLIENGDSSLTARVGRQELSFGAQRAVSQLDWANTRRTFEGARLTLKKENRTFDAFWTHPMRVNDSSFDSPDLDQEFMGLYSSFKGTQNQTADLYFLRFLNGRGTNNFQFNTVGSRWQGSLDNFLWDLEGAYQFGHNTDGTSHVGGMATFGVGRKLGENWKPTLWAYYDWASGDDATGAGNGFHHNLPLAHKYNGFMDLFGRRNLEDVNLQLALQPTERLKLLVWYHYFFLESATDTPYSVVMTPFNAGNVPNNADLGHEIDVVASYKITARQDFVFGYSHFFSGEYYDTTVGVPYRGDADFFYSQWTINF